MARDLLGQIAQARAAMLMRGDKPLILTIGVSTLRALQSEAGEAVLDGAQVLGMPVNVSAACEGFLVKCDLDPSI